MVAMFSEGGLTVANYTNQDKIKYLKRFSILDKEIDRKIEEISYWRGRLEQITSTVSATPRDGGSIYSKTESIVAKIVDLEKEINEEIDQLVELRESIENTITTVEDERERLLLQYRYIDGRTFEWIAAEMHYHWQWVHRLHERALSSVKFLSV